MTDLEYKLAAFPVRSVSFGYRQLDVVEPKQLEEAQLGYGRSTNGESLAIDKPGAWQSSWIVIGREDQCGDPIFVDTSDPDFPVYTAASGEGNWNPQMLSESLAQFSKVLRYLKPLTVGRETPVALDDNPLDDSAEVIEKIGELTACPDANFWSDWFGRDADIE